MMNVNNPADLQTAAYQEKLLKTARYNLLVAIVFTVMNLIGLLVGGGSYYLFSTTIAYYLTFFGYVFDHYTLSTYTFTGLTMAVVPLAAFMLCWFMSRKDSRWLTGATVLFGVDTLALVLLIWWTEDFAGALWDIVFHGWALYSLIRGVLAAQKLRRMQSEDVLYTGEELFEEENTTVDMD